MLKQIAGVFINDAGVFVIQGIISVIVARALGPGLRGVYGVASVMATLSSTIALFGMPNALTYNISRAADRKRGFAEAVAVLLRSVPVSLGVLLLICLVVGSPLARTWLPGIGPATLCASFGLACSVLAQSIVVNVLQGLQDFTVRNRLLAATSLCQAAVIGTIVASGMRLTPVALLWATAGALLAPTATGAAYLARRHGERRRVALPSDWRTSYVGYGLKSYANVIALSVNYRLDALLVNAMVGNAGAGLYGVAVTASELLLWVPNAVANVLYPHIAAASRDNPRRSASLAVGASMYIVAAGAVVLALLAPALVGLVFGSAFRPSAAAVWWLLPGMVALAGYRTLSAAVNGLGHPERTTIATLIGTVLTVAADLVLIPMWGIRGAAAASSIAYTVCLAALLRSYAHLVCARTCDMAVEIAMAPRLVGREYRRAARARGGS